MTTQTTSSSEAATRDRYAAAALAPEAALCCPVDYDPQYLKAIPAEVIEKDYGCGDPSKYLQPGETVLDLGSGTGKICFIASQVVGPAGKVIGVDMTDDMLEVAQRNAPVVAEEIGYANVEFRKGRIQDLGLDLDLLDAELKKQPITDANSYLSSESLASDLRIKHPLIASDTVDVVVSNCVLNLVETHLKTQLFEELFRVLKKGGRAVISDIVSDEEIPTHLQNDAYLWSGCISGAYTEEGFLKAFADAGFHGIEILKRDEAPWQTVEGIEFRSVTIQAWKGKQGPCLERNQAVIYKGPFSKVLDDDGHAMERGKRYAVCDKTFHLYQKPPYREYFEFIEPLESVALEDAVEFPCGATRERHPRETKGGDYTVTTAASNCCDPADGTSCC
ncbi:methyltransferase domain-containing protein [Verrucomicrobiaceae bacterium R5-34]|uniref:Arsenite methyltransferase n=1 Tax=Oceaniferula flava TaxID=2800421 RepID=A0AAE2VCT8_9BACT|nr:methyltransferase domain-containing protein [Oceaniferula flavus]MBK1829453.1 methyltransferase domain-containing protein [Verrucomicrobiaceae bacterium R5-34]MBK1853679.1 methyltransferase domain-containing protein [Oceaniferula flavus]MBM1134985.1 methyltransferase domain-containing protein [Oceaniferula flavus]